MFYGKGAGKLATASAVVADVIECAKNITLDTVYFMKGTLLDKNESEEG